MKSSSTYLVIIILVALGLAGFFLFDGEQAPPSPDSRKIHSDGKAAQVTPIPGTDRKAILLTERAVQRLDITTVPVTSGHSLVVPYAAVMYDTDGSTWVYTNPEPLRYVRHHIEVDRIEGDQAILSDGPPIGTAVVTRGAAELFGVEFGVGK